MTKRFTLTLLAVYLLLIGLATATRLLTFDHFLPFKQYGDETNMYLLARHFRGVEVVPVIPEWLAGYPPLYIWVNMGVQHFVEWIYWKPWAPLPTDYWLILRLFSGLIGVFTTVAVANLGWHLGGHWGAWFAGMAWGFSPWVVDINIHAIPDPFVYLFCICAWVFAARALKTNQIGWMWGSLLAVILAIYAKYPAVYVLVPYVGVMLLFLWRNPRQHWRTALAHGAVGLLAVAYLIWGYGALQLNNREADTVRNDGIRNALNPRRFGNNLWWATQPMGGIWSFLGVIGLGVVVLGVRRRAKLITRDQAWLLGLIAVYTVFGIALSASFTNVTPIDHSGKLRHVFPMTVAMAGLWGAMLTVILRTVYDVLKERGRVAVGITAVVTVLLSAWWFVPMAEGNLDLITYYRLGHTRHEFWIWADDNVPNEGKVIFHPRSDVNYIWDRNKSGYDGRTPFDWGVDETPWKITPQRWAEMGFTFLQLTDGDINMIYNGGSDLTNFLDELFLIKTIHPTPDLLGPTIFFYRMLPPQTPADFTFGEAIRMIGYDLSSDTLQAGETLTLRNYYRVNQPPQTSYNLFVHLVPQDSLTVLAQVDSYPTTEWRPTILWTDTEEVYIGRDIQLTLPADLAEGSYRLLFGLYDYQTGERLMTGNGEPNRYYSLPITVGG